MNDDEIDLSSLEQASILIGGHFHVQDNALICKICGGDPNFTWVLAFTTWVSLGLLIADAGSHLAKDHPGYGDFENPYRPDGFV